MTRRGNEIGKKGGRRKKIERRRKREGVNMERKQGETVKTEKWKDVKVGK